MTDYEILSKPRIRQPTFERVLAEGGSPASPEAAAAWKGITRHGVDPAFALAVFKVESNFGRRGPTVSRRNWGGLSTSEAYPDDGAFAVYPTWAEGAKDMARLLAKYGRNAIQVGRKTDTALTFAPVFATGNSPDAHRRYGEAVASAITRFIEEDRKSRLAAPGGTRPLLVVPPSADRQEPIEIYTSALRASRIRVAPHTGGAIVHTVSAGVPIGVDRVVEGGAYSTEGRRSNRWLRVVTLRGEPLHAPLFTAAVLWRRS